MNASWTPDEIKQVADFKVGDIAVLAKRLGRTVNAILKKRSAIKTGKGVTQKKASYTSIAKDVAIQDESYYRRQFSEISRKYERLLKSQVADERLVSAIIGMAPKSYSPLPQVRRSSRPEESAPQSAVLQFSDTHIGKVTSPSQTLSFGEYNFNIFCARLKYLEESVISIATSHTTTEVPELVIAMLGDMLDGTLTHSNEIGQVDAIFSQFYAGAHAIAQFFRNIAPHFPKVRVYDTVGNHCVDEATEILTRRGWLKHTELNDTDECLGLNKDGKTGVWQKIDEIVREKQVDRMVSFKNRQFNFRGTEHHRFYYFLRGHPGLLEARLSEIERLPILIPSAAMCPGDGKSVPDKYIELCAAVLTDGYIQGKSCIIVYQNPRKEAWVTDAFKRSDLTFTVRRRTRKPPTTICGRPWKGGETSEEVSYRLKSSDARFFMELTGLKKERLPNWVWNMTTSQFRRFLTGLLNGDGTGSLDDNSPTLNGKGREWLGEVQALCAVHGISSSVSPYQPNNANPNIQYRLNICQDNTISLGNTAEKEVAEPTGETVWCVRTKTENFFCRRDGKSYFTGNTRFTNQKRMPTKNRFSNFDKFVYALVKELVRDIKTIEWKLDAQPYQIFEVQKHVFFCAHGDTLRGGDKTLGVPNHAMGRLVSTATQLMTKYGLRSPNYYLLGHLHRDITLPHATGSILVNGGFPGVDEFGLAEMFTPADPTQKLFFVHPKYGKTASYDIALKYAKVRPGHCDYVIPAEFPMT